MRHARASRHELRDRSDRLEGIPEREISLKCEETFGSPAAHGNINERSHEDVTDQCHIYSRADIITWDYG